MKKTLQSRGLALGATLIAIAVVGMASLMAFARTVGTDSKEQIYGTTPFALGYSRGYIAFKGSPNKWGSGVDLDGWINNDAGTETTATKWTGKNNIRSENYYLDYYKGAVLDDVELDVREYLWIDTDSASAQWVVDDTAEATVTPGGPVSGYSSLSTSVATKVHREFHFYTAGTLKTDSPEEVNFSGVIRLGDLDKNEGYEFVSSYGSVYVTKNTTTKHTADSNTWLGTESTKQATDNGAIWAEVSGSASEPLHLLYISAGDRTSGLGYDYSYATYYYLNAASVGQQTIQQYTVNTNGQFDPYSIIEPSDSSWTFDGWYSDYALTNKYATDSPVTVSDSISIYGIYRYNASTETGKSAVRGSVINGTITATYNDTTTDPASNFTLTVDNGSSVTTSFAPSSADYKLRAIYINGALLDQPDDDLSDQSDDTLSTYTFSDISSDQIISVVYYDPTSPIYNVTTSGENIAMITYHYNPAAVSGPAENCAGLENQTIAQALRPGSAPGFADATYISCDVKAGGSIGVEYTIASGFHLTSVTIDGAPAETIANSYTFDNLSANHTIRLTSEKDGSDTPTDPCVDNPNAEGCSPDPGDNNTPDEKPDDKPNDTPDNGDSNGNNNGNNNSNDNNSNNNNNNSGNNSSSNNNATTGGDTSSNTPIYYVTDTDGVAVPNTGHQTAEDTSSNSVLISTLKVALALVGLTGAAIIIISRHHKLSF